MEALQIHLKRVVSDWSPANPSETGNLRSCLRNTEPSMAPLLWTSPLPSPLGTSTNYILTLIMHFIFFVIHHLLSHIHHFQKWCFILKRPEWLGTCQFYTSWERSTDQNVLDINSLQISATALLFNNSTSNAWGSVRYTWCIGDTVESVGLESGA